MPMINLSIDSSNIQPAASSGGIKMVSHKPGTAALTMPHSFRAGGVSASATKPGPHTDIIDFKCKSLPDMLTGTTLTLFGLNDSIHT